MEKKTIGAFISALRKANGMTQKELAQRLNVSDKTVSRWERDDGAPDLSVIPAIAEIFHVTCDELLRGQRMSPAERSEGPQGNETSPRGDKERKRLLKSALSHYQNLTSVAMGISVIGLLVALICNLAFLKAVLGFLCGAIFYAASIVCQAIFINKAFQSVDDSGIDEASLSVFKRKVISLAEKSIGVTVFFIGFTFPLILVDAYLGLGAGSLLLFGSIVGTAFLLVYTVILYFLNGILLKRGVYRLSDREFSVYDCNRKLKKKYTIRLVFLLSLTLLLQALGGETLWSPNFLSSSKGIVFQDYESFIEYMAQDIPMDSYESYYSGTVSVPVPEDQIGEAIYYDRYGNVISEEEALTRTIEDANGDVVCTYIDRNQSVATIRYSAKDGTVLPIRVISQREHRASMRLFDLINTLYCLIYPMELLAALALYFKKRAK